MFRIMMMTLSLIAVVIVNAAANLIPFTGSTTWEIASRLPVLFVPAEYVFSIWAIIHVLMAFWLYCFHQNTDNVGYGLQNWRAILFVISCLLTIIWLVLWHYGYFNWTIIVMVMLLLTLFTIYSTYPKKDDKFSGRVPIAIHLGWIFVMTIMNFSYLLTLRDWSGWGLSDPLWTVIYLTIATMIALHFLYHHMDIALSTVFMWAFIGIAVKNSVDELFVSVAALFLTAVIGAGFFFMKKSVGSNK